jgi:hypothetical protein
MRKILLSITMLLSIVAMTSCSQKAKWNHKQKQAMREALREYRDMVYLQDLTEPEFVIFTDGVAFAIEEAYPVYTTFIELPGRGDTVEVYVVSTIVEELKANPHNMRNIYPYPMLVEEGILPAGLNHQAQRAFYDCFSRKVKQYYPSTLAFFNAVVGNDASQATLADMQMQCAADLFDWVIEVTEVDVVGPATQN